MKNEVCSTLGLTPLEWDILEHRLTADDCLVDVFKDTEGLDHYRPEDIQGAAGLLAGGKLKAAEELDKSLAIEVLADAVEGSTYYVAAEGSESPQKLAAIERAMYSLAFKVGQYIKRDLEARV